MSARGLLAAALVLTACRPTPEPPVAPAHARSPSGLEEPRRWLEALGLELRGGPLPVATVSEEEAAAELSRRSDALWPEDRVRNVLGLMWMMLGDGALGVDPQAVRAGMRLGATKPALAYYGRDRIAVIDKEAASLAPTPLLLTHELVHAYQDEQLPGGVFEALESSTSIDALATRQLTLEGHAEFVSMAAFLRGRTGSLDGLSPALFDPGAARLSSPSAALVYERGALAMLQVYRRGGLDAVEALLREVPPSSEQLLHPAKLGRDAPTVIAPPEIPGAQLVSSDTVGELTLRNLMSARIVDDTVLTPAATGWDGDALLWYETGDGLPMLVWRTVWDREEDVEQFAAAWEALGDPPAASCMLADGRRLDFVVLPPALTKEEAEAIAQALPVPPLPPTDGAASTADAEQQALADLATAFDVTDGTAHMRGTPIRVELPERWGVFHAHGVPFLRGPMKNGFGDNLIIAQTPNVMGFTLDDVAHETVQQLRDVLGAQILREERLQVAGFEAWLLESQGHEAGSQLEMRQIRVVFFTDTHEVALTFSTVPTRWPTVGPIFARMIDSLAPA
ncbi:MAG: hypothetical protein ACE37F_21855 [Nannocystaceae bacterium]|nr:hypothetical protein [bacterium]